jgi:hypothetical protein
MAQTRSSGRSGPPPNYRLQRSARGGDDRFFQWARAFLLNQVLGI